MIPTVLYIDWAAIDLLKQVNFQHPLLEAYVSAISVIFWALWYLFMVPRLSCIHNDHQLSAILWRLRMFTILASAIPVGTITTAILQINRRGPTKFHMSPNITPTSNGGSPDSTSIFSSSLFINWLGYVSLSFFLGILCVQQVLAILHRAKISCYIAFLVSLNWIMLYVFLKRTAHDRWRVVDINGDQKFCLLRTCGPQSLADPDQGFSLCCGLFLFVYENGPSAILPARALGSSAIYHMQTMWMVVQGSLRVTWETMQDDMRAIQNDPRGFQQFVRDVAQTCRTTALRTIQHYL
ncbi:hypothetical protein DE146DRAFT_730109 [Phaeosphaeria sp. MPI-PUGE-AT-0046c]|nr:hypothetical protein DE146DRAFT_730109 [Phaeosphaeria sp. MPI-PUGE-AT-0046c]